MGEGPDWNSFVSATGSVLYLATKLYYRPSGSAIQKKKLKDSGISPDVRAPDEDFVSNFFLENVSDDPDAELGVDFTRVWKKLSAEGSLSRDSKLCEAVWPRKPLEEFRARTYHVIVSIGTR